MSSSAPKQHVPGFYPPIWAVHTLGVLAVGALCAGVFVLAIHRPLAEQAQAMQVSSELARSASALDEKRTKLQRMTLDVHALRPDSGTGGPSLEPPERLAERLRSIGEVAAREGLVVDEIEPGAARAHELCELLAVRVAGTGSPLGVNRFVSGIISDLPDVDVRALTIDARNRGATGLRFSVVLDWRAARTGRAESAGTR